MADLGAYASDVYFSKDELTMKEDLPNFRHFAPARCLLSSGRVLAVKPDTEPLFEIDSDLAMFSLAYCVAANAAAAAFFVYDDVQDYELDTPANSVCGECLLESEAVGTYLADYFDLTPTEVEEVNAFFAED